MRHYSELTHVHRTEPCVEYPGKWLVYHVGELVNECDSLETARASGELVSKAAMGRVSIAWAASEDDPRIGEVWFTEYYTHSYFDCFGRYCRT